MNGQSIRPGVWLYWLGGVIAAVSVAVAAVLVVNSVKDVVTADDGLTRVTVPGSGEIELSEPGEYTLYHEFQTTFRGAHYHNSPGLFQIKFDLVRKDTGEEVLLKPSTMEENYTLNKIHGQSLMRFYADRPGTFVLTGSYPEGAYGPEAVVAVGRMRMLGMMSKVMSGVAQGAAVAIGGILIGTLIAVVTIVKRGKAERQQLVSSLSAAGEQQRHRGTEV